MLSVLQRGQQNSTSPLKIGTRPSYYVHDGHHVFVYRRADKRERILTCQCLINATHNRYSRPSLPTSKINARVAPRPKMSDVVIGVFVRQAGNNKSFQTVLFTSFFTRQSDFPRHCRVSNFLRYSPPGISLASHSEIEELYMRKQIIFVSSYQRNKN